MMFRIQISGDEDVIVGPEDTPASEGAVGPVNVVVGEGKVMACLDVRFLEINNVRIPFRDEFAELLHSGSNAVGVP
ncbi:hypothetical protein TNCT_64351 [Trichonephila clavata]|uniref:Uncharacterized protein n=1 Tax=Trichonephila clavata TaxID=2740835 RepID=A0A8X6G4K1_TRICU|nr:hypothetical protein TNCT_64351 [Trichonephila clavata]